MIPTTGILLRSAPDSANTAIIQDSQYFLLPALLTKRVTNVQTEELHALNQLFIELLDPHISRHLVHLQVYTYSDLIGKALRNSMGPLARPLELLARELDGRMVLFQGYIHSSQSSRMAARLDRGTTPDAANWNSSRSSIQKLRTPCAGLPASSAPLASARRDPAHANLENLRARPQLSLWWEFSDARTARHDANGFTRAYRSGGSAYMRLTPQYCRAFPPPPSPTRSGKPPSLAPTASPNPPRTNLWRQVHEARPKPGRYRHLRLGARDG
ncbi:MAG: hypothetical protein QM813_08675 [Verrucomicrobiota bacterium]